MVKQQIIKSATEVVSMLLRIDDVIASSSPKDHRDLQAEWEVGWHGRNGRRHGHGVTYSIFFLLQIPLYFSAFRKFYGHCRKAQTTKHCWIHSCIMPDFFVDRIVRLESKEKLFEYLSEKAARGGGSIRGVPTSDVKGGNAVNVAYCLAKLGVKVTLFTVADEIGATMIRHAFSHFGDKVNLKIAAGKSGLTTSFEFPYNESRVNVMVSDVGDNANFGPERLASQEDMAILKNADGVMITNWASNAQGTELAEFAFRNSPSAFHFIDPADIETRRLEFSSALSKLASITDSLSINENECNSLADAIKLGKLLGPGFGPEEARNAAKTISEKVGISVESAYKVGFCVVQRRGKRFCPLGKG